MDKKTTQKLVDAIYNEFRLDFERGFITNSDDIKYFIIEKVKEQTSQEFYHVYKENRSFIVGFLNWEYIKNHYVDMQTMMIDFAIEILTELVLEKIERENFHLREEIVF